MRKAKPREHFFWKRVDKQENGCWIWTGKLSAGSHYSKDTPIFNNGSEKGYGYVSALKFAAMLCGHKFLPHGVLSLKRYNNCGNLKCVNPEHWAHLCDTNNKERDDAIKERWALFKKYKTTMLVLGKEYGITRQRVEQIINCKDVTIPTAKLAL